MKLSRITLIIAILVFGLCTLAFGQGNKTIEIQITPGGLTIGGPIVAQFSGTSSEYLFSTPNTALDACVTVQYVEGTTRLTVGYEVSLTGTIIVTKPIIFCYSQLSYITGQCETGSCKLLYRIDKTN